MYLVGFPLLLIPFAIYNIIAFLMPGVSWTAPSPPCTWSPARDWTMSAGDMLIALAILLLFGEMMKSTRIGMRTVVDHASVADPVSRHAGRIHAGASGPRAATFFLLLVISFIDVVGGFRRDAALGRSATSRSRASSASRHPDRSQSQVEPVFVMNAAISICPAARP